MGRRHRYGLHQRYGPHRSGADNRAALEQIATAGSLNRLAYLVVRQSRPPCVRELSQPVSYYEWKNRALARITLGEYRVRQATSE
jgi:hypothetical protein